MSHLSVQGEQSTAAEILALTNLTALAVSGPNEGIIKTGATTFANATFGGSGTIDGSGTTNEITYWVDSDTLGSLTTATYPSLTELSYVKGVTSAIQTQLNNKQTLDATLTALAAYNTNGLLTQTAADTFTGRTITGTTDRISISNGNGVSGNPTIDIAATYVGQTSITTLGTIATGVWSGTIITLAKGGTGAALSDPGANTVMVWDDTTNAVRFATLSGLSYNSGTNILTASGTGITGTDTQVLFFDGANNPAGDAGFTYNKTTDTFTVVNGVFTKASIGTTIDASRLFLVQGDVSGGIATINRTNTATNSVLGTAIIKATSSGDMTDGFGTAFQFAIQDNAGVENLVAAIQVIRDGADNTGQLGFTTYSAGTPTIRARIDATAFYPGANDTLALGKVGTAFSDLSLASGAVINIANDWIATHSAGLLTIGTGDLRITTAGTNANSVTTNSGTQTLTNKTIASHLDKANYDPAVINEQVVGISAVQTVTNKYNKKRVTSVTGNAPTFNTDSCDVLNVTAVTAAISFQTNYTQGTRTTHDTLWVSYTANGAYAITWMTNSEDSTVVRPSTTINGTVDVGFRWNAATTKWRCVAVA